MTIKPHPATGVLINDDLLIRHGRLTDTELRTAKLLLDDGDPRWLVAAKIGIFPLAFSGSGRAPSRARRKPEGGHLSRAEARRDPRQFDMFGTPEPPGKGEDAA